MAWNEDLFPTVDMGNGMDFLDLALDDKFFLKTILEDSESDSLLLDGRHVVETRTMMQPVLYDVPRSHRQQLLQAGACLFALVSSLTLVISFLMSSFYSLFGGLL